MAMLNRRQFLKTADASSGTMQIVPGSSGAASAAPRGHYSDMFDWANNLFADTFA